MDSKEITQRTGRENHGFVRTYVRISGGWPAKFSATWAFPAQGCTEDSKQSKTGLPGEGRRARKLCEIKTPAVSVPFIDRGVGQAPKVSHSVHE